MNSICTKAHVCDCEVIRYWMSIQECMYIDITWIVFWQELCTLVASQEESLLINIFVCIFEFLIYALYYQKFIH